MSINTEILDYVTSAQMKLAEYGQKAKELIESDEEDSKEYEELMDNIELLDWTIGTLYETRYNIVDSNKAEVYNFIDKTDDEIRAIISNWRYLFEIDVYPYSTLALRNYTIFKESQALPEGTLPTTTQSGLVLTTGANGKAYWASPTVYIEIIDY